MPGKGRDLNIGITSSFDGRGFKSAEQSGKAMARQLDRMERDQRRQVQMQVQAAKEMARAEAEKAEMIERVNERQREAMEATGRVALGVGAAIGIGLALAGKAAVDWESDWAGVTKTVSGSSSELAALEDDLRSLARTLPATHGEIAAVAEAAGQLGVRREDVARFTETMIALGETTNLTADEAATSLAQLMNIMGTAPESVDRLGSTLVALGNNGASTERDIVEMAQRIAGAGALVGATEGEVLALSSALSSMGVTAQLGGGVASRVLQDLYSAVESGGDTLQKFADVAGMTADQFAAAFRDDPVAALAAMAEGLNGVESSGGNVVQTLKDLGFQSSEEQRILLQLKSNSDLVTESLGLQNEAWDANTALQEEAAKRYATTEAQLQIARNAINDAAIDIGANFLPVLAGAANKVAAMATFFGGLPPEVQQFVTVLGTAAAGVGLLGGAALIAVPKLHALRQTLDDMNGGSSRLGKAAGGFASFLAGPWGAALGVATIAVGAWAASQGEAKARVDALTQTLDEQTGAITTNSREWAAKRIIDDDALDSVERLGVDMNDLTDAMLGNADAAARVREQMVGAHGAYELTAEDHAKGREVAEAYTNDLRELEGHIHDASKETEEARRNQAAMNEVTGEGSEAQEELAGATEETTGAVEKQAGAVDELLEQLKELADLNMSAAEAEASWAQQMLDNKSIMEDFNKAVEEGGDAVKKNRSELDLMTEAGQIASETMLSTADAAWANVDAAREQSASTDELRNKMAAGREEFVRVARQMGLTKDAANRLADEYGLIPTRIVSEVQAKGIGQVIASIDGMIAEIDAMTGTVTIDGKKVPAERKLSEVMDAIGTSTENVTIDGEPLPANLTLEGLMDRIKKSDGDVTIGGDNDRGRNALQTLVRAISGAYEEIDIGADTGAAYSSVGGLMSYIRGQSATVAIYGEYSGTHGGPGGGLIRGMSYNADGGLVEYYAGGGMRENHIAQIAPAGTMRVWAEPETGGEAYIPLAPSKRPRSEEILGEVASQFGMYVGHQAAANTAAGAQGATSGAGGGGSTVALSPETEALLARVANRPTQLWMDRRVLAESVDEASRKFGGKGILG